MTQHSRVLRVVLLVALTGVLGSFLADRTVLALVSRHQQASPQVALASAMAGLFVGGLLALLALLILLRAGSSRPQ